MANEAYIYEAIRTPRPGQGQRFAARGQARDPGNWTYRRTAHLAPEYGPERDRRSGARLRHPGGRPGRRHRQDRRDLRRSPDTVAGTQVNRFCASALEAVNIAAQKVRPDGTS